jgi:hypothetical protein
MNGSCPTCGRPTTLLFVSWVCDYCDAPTPTPKRMTTDAGNAGYVIHHGPCLWTVTAYVFETSEGANAMMRRHSVRACDVRRVLSTWAFQWVQARTLPGVRRSHTTYSVRPNKEYPGDGPWIE